MPLRANEVKLVFSVLALSGAVGGCSRRGPATPPGSHEVTIERINGPYVLAGTAFDAELEQPIGTDVNEPGDVFVARVETPLHAPTGQEVVPAGARVIGKVVESLDERDVALALKFEFIETTRGPAPVRATLESAGGYARVAMAPPVPTTETETEPAPWEFDALLRPLGAPAIGGGPPSDPEAPRAPRAVRVPNAGVVRLVLLDRVIPPGVTVERPPREQVRPYGQRVFPPFYDRWQ
jgi:hypothetical protein